MGVPAKLFFLSPGNTLEIGRVTNTEQRGKTRIFRITYPKPEYRHCSSKSGKSSRKPAYNRAWLPEWDNNMIHFGDVSGGLAWWWHWKWVHEPWSDAYCITRVRLCSCSEQNLRIPSSPVNHSSGSTMMTCLKKSAQTRAVRRPAMLYAPPRVWK